VGNKAKNKSLKDFQTVNGTGTGDKAENPASYMMVVVLVVIEIEFLNYQACMLNMIYGEHSLCENQRIK
jgi:hypothetical protein